MIEFCHAWQLGRHTRMHFASSRSRAVNNFDLIHCDLRTLLVVSVSGYKYYLVILDDGSHYLWTFPLCLKSDTFSTLSNFFVYVSTQFSRIIKSIQCDNKHASLTICHLEYFSSPMACFCRCLSHTLHLITHTLHLITVKPSALCVPLTMSSAPFGFRLRFLHAFEQTHSTLPHICLIDYPPRLWMPYALT
jgi:hypothetical protein